MGTSDDDPPDSAPTRQHAAPSALPRGTLIGGKYRVERALGAGGMALVVEATHIALGRRVAIKVLQGDAATASEVLSRFQREAQIAAQLPGENIARVTDLGQLESGEPYLVMELLVGRDLDAELMVRGPLPVEEAVDHVLQACEGVAEAHAAGLVHRDLKPGNLFLTRRRDGTAVVKVLDFGISKAAPGGADHSLTKTSTTFGTPLYMSPEQVQSAKHVDASSDQHALGAILYALLTGRPPFEAESLTALAVLIATQPPRPVRELRREVPAELDAAIDRALAKRPRERFPDLTGFARAIAPFGGADARSSVSCIEQALSHRHPAPAPPLIMTSSNAGLPVGRAGGLSSQTSAGLSSGIGRDLTERRRRILGLSVIGGGLALAAAIAIVVGVRSATQERLPLTPETSAAAATTTSPADTADSGPVVSPAGSASDVTVPAPTDTHSVPLAPPSSATGAAKKPPVRNVQPAPAGAGTSKKKPSDVFGTRR